MGGCPMGREHSQGGVGAGLPWPVPPPFHSLAAGTPGVGRPRAGLSQVTGGDSSRHASSFLPLPAGPLLPARALPPSSSPPRAAASSSSSSASLSLSICLSRPGIHSGPGAGAARPPCARTPGRPAVRLPVRLSARCVRLPAGPGERPPPLRRPRLPAPGPREVAPPAGDHPAVRSLGRGGYSLPPCRLWPVRLLNHGGGLSRQEYWNLLANTGCHTLLEHYISCCPNRQLP